MAYEYNPLIPLNLQKKQNAATPGDIERLQGEIDTLTTNVRNKVPKFFTSIEELEINEIGEYQGETNETFTNGYFYKRGSGTTEIDVKSETTLTPTYYVNLTLWSDNTQVVKLVNNVQRSNAVYHGGVTLRYNMSNGDSVMIFGFPVDNGFVTTTRLMPAISPCSQSDWWALPKAYNDTQNRWVDYDIDVRGTGSWEWDVTIDGEFKPQLGGWGFEAYIHSLYYPLPDIGYVPCFAIGIPSGIAGFGIYIHPKPVTLPFLLDIDGLWFSLGNIFLFDPLNLPYSTEDSFIAKNFEYVNIPTIARVDTQPSLDPSDFATATQGTEADNALQNITASGTGYLSLTASAKSGAAGAKTQAISGTLTVQPIDTADASHQGLAEASDVKSYIADNTATKAQGTAADTALQQVVHGTDGLYVTTTVTQKASNEQNIYTALTLQDVETADDTHKGVAEASNVRNMFNIISAQSEAYGVMWDTANPSPQCIRIGNIYNHQTLPVQSGMIGGVMADDGTFTPFDNQADWTQATQARDGSDGQVMIKIPQHWRKLAQYGTIREVLISPIELPGYVKIPTRYCGAYEASIERSTGKLCSVNNATADFRGGDNTSAWDGTYRTLLNRPVTNLNQSEFLAAARLRAAGTSWNNLLYKICRDIYWLFVTEYATLDSQADYNAALDANGFKQGGLGAGVTTWDGTSWDNFNLYNPFVTCGYLDEYGNQTAIKNFSLYNADSTLLKTFSVNSYRGIMLPFGHIWKHIADVLINVESGDGNSTVYLCDNPANFNSSSVTNYNFICNQMRTDSYVKEMYLGDNADIFAIAGGGNSTSYYCDHQWCGDLPASGSSLRCWLSGGAANDGSRGGLACANSNHDPGSRGRNIGSRLCFIP